MTDSRITSFWLIVLFTTAGLLFLTFAADMAFSGRELLPRHVIEAEALVAIVVMARVLGGCSDD